MRSFLSYYIDGGKAAFAINFQRRKEKYSGGKNLQKEQFIIHPNFGKKENNMKKSILLTVLFCLVYVSVAIAESSVDGSVVNSVGGQTVTNTAVGKGSKASLGAVKMEESKVGGSVFNSVVGQTVTNTALGNESEANLGVVKLKDSKVGGSIVNTVAGQTVTNTAAGNESEANMGVVDMK